MMLMETSLEDDDPLVKGVVEAARCRHLAVGKSPVDLLTTKSQKQIIVSHLTANEFLGRAVPLVLIVIRVAVLVVVKQSGQSEWLLSSLLPWTALDPNPKVWLHGLNAGTTSYARVRFCFEEKNKE